MDEGKTRMGCPAWPYTSDSMSRPNSWLYCLLYSRFMCARIVTELPNLRHLRAKRSPCIYWRIGGGWPVIARKALTADQFQDASVSTAAWFASIPIAWRLREGRQFGRGFRAKRARYVLVPSPPASHPRLSPRQHSAPSRLRARPAPNLASESPTAR